MKKLELEIITVTHSVTQTNNFAVVLGETDGARRLPIVIGQAEAQAIVVARENLNTGRPLTHDLFKNMMDHFNVELKEVLINNLHEGVFYARLICLKDGEEHEIDSRTSDALALATRFDCPVYTFDFILDEAGIILEDPLEEDRPKRKKAKSEKKKEASIEELNAKLEEALEGEDYEKAAKIRDQIKLRKD